MSFGRAFDFIRQSIPGSGSSGRTKTRPNRTGVFVTTQTAVVFGDEQRISFEAVRFPDAAKTQAKSVDYKMSDAVELEAWMDHPK